MSVFFYQPNLPDGDLFLDGDEAMHCARVLRKRPGDEIMVMDGKGKHYRATLITSSPRRCELKITKTIEIKRDPYMIHLAIAPTKNADRIEWLAEKGVELGLHRLSLLQCDHSERKRFRTDRLEKKMISAMKQSQQAFAPILDRELIPFDEFIEQNSDNVDLMMAYIDPENKTDSLQELALLKDCSIMIGPEGDFSEREINKAREAGIRMVGLGPHRLRTETAGLAAVVIQTAKLY